MAEGIYAPDGTFIPFSGVDLGTELATRQNAGLTLGEITGWLDVLPDPDPVLRKRHDDASILGDLSADDQVTTTILSPLFLLSPTFLPGFFFPRSWWGEG